MIQDWAKIPVSILDRTTKGMMSTWKDKSRNWVITNQLGETASRILPSFCPLCAYSSLYVTQLKSYKGDMQKRVRRPLMSGWMLLNKNTILLRRLDVSEHACNQPRLHTAKSQSEISILNSVVLRPISVLVTLRSSLQLPSGKLLRKPSANSRNMW